MEMAVHSSALDLQVNEAAQAGLESAHHFIHILSQQEPSKHAYMPQDGSSVAADVVSHFKKVVRLLSRKGHARVKCGPSKLEGIPSSDLQDGCMGSFHMRLNAGGGAHESISTDMGVGFLYGGHAPPQIPTAVSQSGGMEALVRWRSQLIGQQKLHAQPLLHGQPFSVPFDGFTTPFLSLDNSVSRSPLSSARSFLSSLSMDGSVSNQSFSQFHERAASKRKCFSKGDGADAKCSISGRCHCSKRRKSRVRRVIKVPAISTKLADIPADDYHWRKYGQKPIKGSPHPRFVTRPFGVVEPARKNVQQPYGEFWCNAGIVHVCGHTSCCFLCVAFSGGIGSGSGLSSFMSNLVALGELSELRPARLVKECELLRLCCFKPVVQVQESLLSCSWSIVHLLFQLSWTWSHFAEG